MKKHLSRLIAAAIVIMLAVCPATLNAVPKDKKAAIAAAGRKAGYKPDDALKNYCFNPLGIIKTNRTDPSLPYIRKALTDAGLSYKFSHERWSTFRVTDAGSRSILGRQVSSCKIESRARELETKYFFTINSEEEAIEFFEKLGGSLSAMGAKLRSKHIEGLQAYRAGNWQNLELSLSMSKPKKVKIQIEGKKKKKKVKQCIVTLTTTLPARNEVSNRYTVSAVKPMSRQVFGIDGLSLTSDYDSICEAIALRQIPARIDDKQVTPTEGKGALSIEMALPGVAWCPGFISQDEKMYETPKYRLFVMHLVPKIAAAPGATVDGEKSIVSLYDRLIGELRATKLPMQKGSTDLLKKLKVDKNIYSKARRVWMVHNGAATDYYILRRIRDEHEVLVVSLMLK